MNATSSPGVSAPRPTPIAPSSSTITTARLGIISRKVQNRADRRTFATLVSSRRRADDVVLLGDVGRAAERLDHPDADGTLLGQRGEVALLVLHVARDHDVALLEAHREPHDRRGRRGDDQPERPVEVEQHEGGHHDLGDVDDQEQHPEAEEPADGGQVGGRAGQELARLPLAVEAHRELLQPLVEVVAHLGLDLEDRLVLHPAAPPDQERLEDAEAEHQQARAGGCRSRRGPRSGRR